MVFEGYNIVFQNKDYASLFVINFFLTVCTSMLVPVFPLWIINVVKVSPATVFYILAAIGIGSSILNIVIGYISDLIGKRKLIMEVKLILACIRALLYSFFPYVPIIIATSWLTQLSSGSLTFAILADKINKNNDIKDKGTITSTIRTGVSLGFIFGPAIGTFIISIVPYEKFFLIYAGMNLLLLIAFHYLIEDNKSAKIKRKKNPKPINVSISQIRFCLIMLLPILLFLGSQANGPLLSLYVESISNEWMLALVFGIGPLFELIAFPLIGKMTDKIGITKIIFLGIIGEILYFGMLSFSSNVWIILLIQIFGCFYIAVIFSSLMIYIQDKFMGLEGFSSSLYYSCISISGALGNIILGSTMLKKSYQFGFITLGAIALCGLIVFIILETPIFSNYNTSKKD
ncbi:MFS transporter [Metabacillus halosaccharovorans]|uniref:MFS transporter n=1 Tax=Metabacillus halosaccharovorans TaxID=930124 RepID=UPI0031FA1B59